MLNKQNKKTILTTKTGKKMSGRRLQAMYDYPQAQHEEAWDPSAGLSTRTIPAGF